MSWATQYQMIKHYCMSDLLYFFPSPRYLLLSTLYQSAYKTRDFELSYCVCKAQEAKKKLRVREPAAWMGYESLFERKSIFLLLFILALLSPPFQ